MGGGGHEGEVYTIQRLSEQLKEREGRLRGIILLYRCPLTSVLHEDWTITQESSMRPF